MSTTFNHIKSAFNTISYPFNNILLGLFVRGTTSSRVTKNVMPSMVRVIAPVMPVMTKVAEPVTPTYTRIQ